MSKRTGLWAPWVTIQPGPTGPDARLGRKLGHTLDHCADYIQLFNGDTDLLVKSMDNIQKTAAILEGIKEHAAIAKSVSEELAA